MNRTILLIFVSVMMATSGNTATKGAALTDAITAFKSGDYAKAAASALVAEKEEPKEGKATLLRGRIALAEKKWDEAEKFFQAAQTKSPDNPLVGFYRGDLALLRGEFARALAAYDEFLEKKPKDPDGRLRRIYGLIRQGQLEVAAREAVSLDGFSDKHPGFYFARAAVAEKQGKREDAKRFLHNAQTLYGDAVYLTFYRDYLLLIGG